MICEICGAKKIQLLFSYTCPSNHFEVNQNDKKYYVYFLFTDTEIVKMKNENFVYCFLGYYTSKEEAERNNKHMWGSILNVIPVVDKGMVGCGVKFNHETQEFENVNMSHRLALQ